MHVALTVITYSPQCECRRREDNPKEASSEENFNRPALWCSHSIVMVANATLQQTHKIESRGLLPASILALCLHVQTVDSLLIDVFVGYLPTQFEPE